MTGQRPLPSHALQVIIPSNALKDNHLPLDKKALLTPQTWNDLEGLQISPHS